MNKKKALFLYELRRSWWICLVGICLAMIGCLIVWQEASQLGTQGLFWDSLYSVSVGSKFSAALVWTICLGHHVLVVAVALVMLLVYSDLYNRRNQEYLHCLPYTKTQRFMMRTVLMYGYITVCCLVFSLGVIAIRQIEIDNIRYNTLLSPAYAGLLANETIWHTIRSLVLLWLILMALYTIFLMMNTLVNVSVLANIMAIGVITAPKVLTWTINQFYLIFCGKEWINYSSMTSLADIFWGNATYVGAGLEAGVYSGTMDMTGDGLNTHTVSYDNMLLQYVLMIVVIAAALLIAWKANKSYDLAKKRMLVPIRWARNTAAVGMGFCFAAGIGATVGWTAVYAQRVDFSTSAGITGLAALLLLGGVFSMLLILLLKIKVKN